MVIYETKRAVVLRLVCPVLCAVNVDVGAGCHPLCSESYGRVDRLLKVTVPPSRAFGVYNEGGPCPAPHAQHPTRGAPSSEGMIYVEGEGPFLLAKR